MTTLREEDLVKAAFKEVEQQIELIYGERIRNNTISETDKEVVKALYLFGSTLYKKGFKFAIEIQNS